MTTAPPRQIALELDVLRGFAAILMVVNHAGLQWLSPSDAGASLSGAVVFLGSLAPAVFFFVTGFGSALGAARRARPAPLRPLLVRSGLLVVADQFFAWTNATAWVLDFFSFIALSTLVVGILSRLERPVRACGVLVVLILVIRYVVGPVLARSIELPPIIDWLVGVRGIAHVSYPASPWLVYPLLGMMTGRWYAKGRAERVLRSTSMAATGTVFAALLGISLWMSFNGHGFFRWGTVSSSFFLFSMAFLLALSAVSLGLAKRVPQVATALALSGIASFALIPLHFALLGFGSLSLSAWLPLTPTLAGACVVALLLVCFVVSKSFATAMQHDGLARRAGWLYPLLLVLLAGLIVFTLVAPTAGPRQGLLEAFVGQMLIAALLAMRAGTPRRPASVEPLGLGNSA